MRQLFINHIPTEKTALLKEDGRITEVWFERPERTPQVGAIYSGKVTNVEKGIKAAFVDIGTETNGFLHLSDCNQPPVEGAKILVQIKKAPIGSKGPVLTTDLSIGAANLVYLPVGKQVHVSRKLTDDQQQELRSFFVDMLEGEEGVILRTAAVNMQKESLIEEWTYLRHKWKNRTVRNEPGLVHSTAVIPDQVLQHYPLHTFDQIIIDDAATSKEWKKSFPSYTDHIKWEREFEAALGTTVQSVQERIVNPVVEGSLHIDETEAMVVIDVNSAAYTGKSNKQQTALQTNMKAVVAIVEEIRLRRLAGIILIDFINMDDKKSESKVLQAFKRTAKQHGLFLNVHGFTRLGLLEVTRKKEQPSWKSFLGAHDFHYSDTTTFFQLERAILSLNNSAHEAVLIGLPKEWECLKNRLISSGISSKIPQELFFYIDPNSSTFSLETGSVETVREIVASRGFHIDKGF
ncbi:ribonuclease E/G [Thalassobacillus hwangdonensis]|uniref:Ribonuclease E/G n=1 Tax=Thalassobacillus hwangdonensis TaxID=546108 RepID=A0ABW3KYZ6_9BACI